MIKAVNIKKTYGGNEVLKGVSLEIEKNDFAVILGASGSGKSTLLSILSGLEKSDDGKVEYDGANLNELCDRELTQFRKKHVGFVFQQYYLLSHLNVESNVKLGADLIGNKEFKDIIAAVGLSDKLKRKPF